jgi:ubiquinone biosynthesis protein UbiJ
MLAYRVPREPSTPRIAVWRKLRGLGVAQVGDGLVALPEDDRSREQLEWVAADVEAAGGTAALWRAEMLARRDEHHLITQLQQARAEEYRTVVVQAEQARTGTDADLARTVDRLRRELRRIRRRDYFPPPEQEVARQVLETLTGRAGPPASTSRAGGRA